MAKRATKRASRRGPVRETAIQKAEKMAAEAAWRRLRKRFPGLGRVPLDSPNAHQFRLWFCFMEGWQARTQYSEPKR